MSSRGSSVSPAPPRSSGRSLVPPASRSHDKSFSPLFSLFIFLCEFVSLAHTRNKIVQAGHERFLQNHDYIEAAHCCFYPAAMLLCAFLPLLVSYARFNSALDQTAPAEGGPRKTAMRGRGFGWAVCLWARVACSTRGDEMSRICTEQLSRKALGRQSPSLFTLARGEFGSAYQSAGVKHGRKEGIWATRDAGWALLQSCEAQPTSFPP